MDNFNFHNVYHHLHERYILHILCIGNSHPVFHICRPQPLTLWVAVLVGTVALVDLVFAFGLCLSLVSLGAFELGLAGTVAFECW